VVAGSRWDHSDGARVPFSPCVSGHRDEPLEGDLAWSSAPRSDPVVGCNDVATAEHGRRRVRVLGSIANFEVDKHGAAAQIAGDRPRITGELEGRRKARRVNRSLRLSRLSRAEGTAGLGVVQLQR